MKLKVRSFTFPEYIVVGSKMKSMKLAMKERMSAGRRSDFRFFLIEILYTMCVFCASCVSAVYLRGVFDLASRVLRFDVFLRFGFFFSTSRRMKPIAEEATSKAVMMKSA